MNEFLEYLIKNLVDEPNKVQVFCKQEENGWKFQISVASNDIGKVVGRKGFTIKALGTVVSAVYARLGHRVHLEIVE